MISQKVKRLLCVRVVVLDSAYRLRIALLALRASQHHRLVAAHPGGLVDRMGVTALVSGIGLGADDEKSTDGMEKK